LNLLLNWDYRLFEFFNSWAGRSRIFDALVIFFGQYFVYVLVVVLILWWFVNSNKLKSRQALIMALFSFIIARFGVTELIRAILPRQRPFLSHHVIQLISKGAEPSFPSGHATALFAIAMAIYFYNKKLGYWLFAVAAVVSVARVIAGVHYPSDILAGAAVGIITAWLMERFLGVKISKLSVRTSLFSDKFLPFTKR
jgi:undecaprenyl-diphosphatase